jgi:hypothetical protein
MQSIYTSWGNRSMQILEAPETQGYSAVSNAKIYHAWSQNTRMGQAFENDFQWLGISWLTLAQLLDEDLKGSQDLGPELAEAYKIRGLYSRAAAQRLLG